MENILLITRNTNDFAKHPSENFGNTNIEYYNIKY